MFFPARDPIQCVLEIRGLESRGVEGLEIDL